MCVPELNKSHLKCQKLIVDLMRLWEDMKLLQTLTLDTIVYNRTAQSVIDSGIQTSKIIYIGLIKILKQILKGRRGKKDGLVRANINWFISFSSPQVTQVEQTHHHKAPGKKVDQI